MRAAKSIDRGNLPLSIVILAAGQGKRMKSALPKVLQPLAGKPLLKHVIDTARELEPAAIHVVYGHGGDQVRESLKDENVSWVLQAQQLGTGHAVAQAMPQVPNDHLVLVLYGDVPLNRKETLRQLLQLSGPQSMALLSVLLEDPTGYGRVIRNVRGQVMRIVEEKDASKRELKVRECNTGVMAIPARLLKKWLTRLNNDNAQGEYYLTDIIAAAVKNRLKVNPLIAPTLAEVLGINDKIQLATVEAEYRKLKSRELMLEGVTVIDPARLDVRGKVTVGKDVQLDINVVLEGEVKLGDGVSIGPGCVIKNSEIGAGTRILHNCSITHSVIGAGVELLPNCVIERATTESNCIIGPFARLRPGAQLSQGVHVGNFVEIKNSSLGVGSKANHLSYLGDTTLGQGVNVGAGTVTCNYDGVNKHRTQIEDGAFIGSGSMLVAPVCIGANATIGAGSTITKDAPAEQLTLERSKQISIPGWRRPQKKPK